MDTDYPGRLPGLPGVRIKSKIGMLWFDNHPMTGTFEKARKAMNYYTNKYATHPTWLEMHDSQATDQEAAEIERELGLRVARTGQVLPNHFWMGVES